MNIKLVKQQDGRSKGFGFVEFDSHKSAKKAFEAENGRDIDGRAISVDFSGGKPTGDRPAFGGRDGGQRSFGGGAPGGGSTLFVGNLGFKTTE